LEKFASHVTTILREDREMVKRSQIFNNFIIWKLSRRVLFGGRGFSPTFPFANSGFSP